MYNIAVPVTLDGLKNYGHDSFTEVIRQMKAERVFISIDCMPEPGEDTDKMISELRGEIAFLHELGCEVGVWYWALQSESPRYTKIFGFLNRESKLQNCPLDENFLYDHAEFAKKLAAAGTDIIMYDDDFRFGFIDSGFGCMCRYHMKAMEERLCEPLSEGSLYEKIFTGGKNRYRDAWYEATGESLKNFALKMREAVDTVNPRVRIGACSCMTVWDTDGVDSYTLARCFAGKTRPFVRLIGAPYWAAMGMLWGNRIQDVIELERMQLGWRREEDGDIEVFSEGDVYPRPRFRVPAAYLEALDTALRADGGSDGILKYVLDYTAKPDYETGYVKTHVRNESLYGEIKERFDGRRTEGIRIYESMHKLQSAYFTPEEIADRSRIQDMFFCRAERMLACHGIPTIYSGEGICGIAFGENIKYVPEDAFSRGLIIDIKAAEYLMSIGVDTGITAIRGKIRPQKEYIPSENNYIRAGYNVYATECKEGAEILGYFICDNASGVNTMPDGEKKLPSAFIYENPDNQRFMVLPVDAYDVSYSENELYYRNYYRAKQFIAAAERLSGKAMPAKVSGHPDMYMICKKGEASITVGLWNFSPDAAFDVTVELGEEYNSVEFFGGAAGGLAGGRIVKLTTDIRPFGFCGLEAKLFK